LVRSGEAFASGMPLIVVTTRSEPSPRMFGSIASGCARMTVDPRDREQLLAEIGLRRPQIAARHDEIECANPVARHEKFREDNG